MSKPSPESDPPDPSAARLGDTRPAPEIGSPQRADELGHVRTDSGPGKMPPDAEEAGAKVVDAGGDTDLDPERPGPHGDPST